MALSKISHQSAITILIDPILRTNHATVIITRTTQSTPPPNTNSNPTASPLTLRNKINPRHQKKRKHIHPRSTKTREKICSTSSRALPNKSNRGSPQNNSPIVRDFSGYTSNKTSGAVARKSRFLNNAARVGRTFAASQTRAAMRYGPSRDTCANTAAVWAGPFVWRCSGCRNGLAGVFGCGAVNTARGVCVCVCLVSRAGGCWVWIRFFWDACHAKKFRLPSRSGCRSQLRRYFRWNVSERKKQQTNRRLRRYTFWRWIFNCLINIYWFWENCLTLEFHKKMVIF